ncbi:electron transfer flavoprotein subunit beta [Ancylobacter sp. G4_0304]|uniref:electron transfer flavoprotein subunit beta n=1 Tax=Ancylobacter sp. G4_0304 TaxID=3114289 RepID=UPI0039C628EF
MKIVVLFSAGRHPASGTPCPVPVELQALRLARELAGADEVIGLHAGPVDGAPLDVLGHGLGRLIHLRMAAGDDPLPALADALDALAPDLILAGRVGQGSEESGLLPYALARRLGRPILADAAALAAGDDGTLTVEQALPRGVRRRVVLRLPALLTVHPAAPPALPFTFAAARRGTIERRDVAPAPATASEMEERPYRPRPKLIARAAPGASAAERLKAATQAASSGGRLLVDPAPEEAAREILGHLRAIGVLRR